MSRNKFVARLLACLIVFVILLAPASMAWAQTPTPPPIGDLIVTSENVSVGQDVNVEFTGYGFTPGEVKLVLKLIDPTNITSPLTQKEVSTPANSDGNVQFKDSLTVPADAPIVELLVQVWYLDMPIAEDYVYVMPLNPFDTAPTAQIGTNTVTLTESTSFNASPSCATGYWYLAKVEITKDTLLYTKGVVPNETELNVCLALWIQVSEDGEPTLLVDPTLLQIASYVSPGTYWIEVGSDQKEVNLTTETIELTSREEALLVLSRRQDDSGVTLFYRILQDEENVTRLAEILAPKLTVETFSDANAVPLAELFRRHIVLKSTVIEIVKGDPSFAPLANEGAFAIWLGDMINRHQAIQNPIRNAVAAGPSTQDVVNGVVNSDQFKNDTVAKMKADPAFQQLVRDEVARQLAEMPKPEMPESRQSNSFWNFLSLILSAAALIVVLLDRRRRAPQS